MTEAHIRVTSRPAGRLSVVPSEVRGDTESLAPALIVPVSVELFPRDSQTLVLDRLAATLWTAPAQGPRLDARLGIAPNYPNDVNETGTLGLVQCAKPLADELRLPIAREQWAREIGPALGHDRQRLVAVRLPSADGPLGLEVVVSYSEASRAYDRAEWRECIQKCRDVRTHIERAVRQDHREHVAAAVARRLGTDGEDPRM
jgi:hypothetical protein